MYPYECALQPCITQHAAGHCSDALVLCRSKAVAGVSPQQNILQAAFPSANDMFVKGSSVVVGGAGGYTAAEVGKLCIYLHN